MPPNSLSQNPHIKKNLFIYKSLYTKHKTYTAIKEKQIKINKTLNYIKIKIHMNDFLFYFLTFYFSYLSFIILIPSYFAYLVQNLVNVFTFIVEMLLIMLIIRLLYHALFNSNRLLILELLLILLLRFRIVLVVVVLVI